MKGKGRSPSVFSRSISELPVILPLFRSLQLSAVVDSCSEDLDDLEEIS